MKLFYVPIFNSNSVSNYNDTVVKRISNIGVSTAKILNNKKAYGVWGFTRGPHNDREYDKMNKGDILIFCVKDKAYQSIGGFGYINGFFNNKKYSLKLWNNEKYSNIITINKFIKFKKPFHLSKKHKVIPNIKNIPEENWHKGYEMFRERKIQGLTVEKFIEMLLQSIDNKVLYDLGSQKQKNKKIMQMIFQYRIHIKNIIKNIKNDLKKLTEKILKFRNVRDWTQYHDPKNLAEAISIEASELLENFLWKTKEESRNLNKEKIQDIKDEIADVLIYLIVLSEELDIDLIKSAEEKLKKNGKKYPVDKVKGRSKKYDEL